MFRGVLGIRTLVIWTSASRELFRHFFFCSLMPKQRARLHRGVAWQPNWIVYWDNGILHASSKYGLRQQLVMKN